MLRSILLITLMVLSLVIVSLPLEYMDRLNAFNKNHENGKKAVVNEKLTDNLVEKLNKNHPQVLLIGNSMLGEAVDADTLSNLLDMPCLKVWVGGSGSAWWYLVIKNVVPLLTPAPNYIGVFFRDNDLTLPQYRTTGKQQDWINNLSGFDEPILRELAYSEQLSFPERLLTKAFPVYLRTSEIQEETDKFLKRIVAAAYYGSDQKLLVQSLNTTFADNQMDENLFDQRQVRDEKFSDIDNDMDFIPEKSFLPAMIKHSEEVGAELFLIRVKRKRDLEPGKQSEELVNYIKKLKTYLEERNVELIDYTDSDAISEKHYGGGDHLNRQSGRTAFTSLLAKDLFEQIITKSPTWLANQPKEQ